MYLKQTVQELYHQMDSMDETITSLRADLRGLRNQLATLQWVSNREKDTLDRTIKSLGAKEESSSVSITIVTHVSLKFTSIRYGNHAAEKNCARSLYVLIPSAFKSIPPSPTVPLGPW